MLGQPFRGSAAVAAGFVTLGELRGPHFRRLFTDVFVRSEVEIDHVLRAVAAYTAVGGVLGGYSAAELLGASCGPAGVPVEVVLPGGRRRDRPGLVVRSDVLGADEVTVAGGVAATTALRTAFDLARRPPLLEAVVALDALCRVGEFSPQEVITFGFRHVGARGRALLPGVVRLANPLAGSPMETRVRLAVRADGLVEPVLQHPVGPYILDLAYPGIRLGIEYDGREHLTQERAMRDLVREAYLARAGWQILRFCAADVLGRPWWVAAKVREQVILAGRARGMTLHAFDPR